MNRVVMSSEWKRGPGSASRVCRVALAGLGLLLAFWASRLSAQEITPEDYEKLRINEIVAANDTVLPKNWNCRFVDMLEIYNGSDKDLPLDGGLGHIRVTDGSRFVIGQELGPIRYFSFKNHPVKTIRAGQRIILFCDEVQSREDRTGACELERQGMDLNELHAPFRLDNEGETVWLERVPLDDPDNPVEIHRITFPPLPDDVAYVRFPETVEEDPANETWVFSTLPTFGVCSPPVPGTLSSCLGAENTGATPVAPDIEMIDYSTNGPAADEDVVLRVRVTDEKMPDENNIVSVVIGYRVDSGEWQTADMTLIDLLTEDDDPLDTWSIWEGAIPGQAAGTEVEFYFEVTDADGESDSDPRAPHCPTGVGSCDPTDLPAELGPGCVLGQDCGRPLRYFVGSTYDGPVSLNEVVANNVSIFEDPTEDPIDCPPTNANCTFDDFVELCNSSALNVNLEGLVLARGPFRPERGWTFQFGSEIGPNQRLVVWTDNDGKDPVAPTDPPNPNNPAAGEFHTDFTLDATSDEIFIFEPVPGDGDYVRYQLVDGARWGLSGRYFTGPQETSDPALDPLALASRSGMRDRLLEDESLSRFPDCNRASGWTVVTGDFASPEEPNKAPAQIFRRGDSNLDGTVDLTDAINNLEVQFLGSPMPSCPDTLDVDDSGLNDITDPINLIGTLFLGDPPIVPAPGRANCGPDPTPDDPFEDCLYRGAAGEDLCVGPAGN